MKVIFANGYTTEIKDKIAEILLKRGTVKRANEPKAEPKPEAKK